MRPRLILPVAFAALFGIATAPGVQAAPVTSLPSQTVETISQNSIVPVYYYHHHRYRYHWHGHYYNHRRYHNHHWRYY